jgi:hypothetical protein
VRYVGPLLTFEQAEAWLLNYEDDLDRYGFWAVEVHVGPRLRYRGGPLRQHVLYRKLRDPDN